MKNDIHPAYFPESTITCACGTSFHAGSTVEKISVELCANCHPFYTGKQKLVDTARRVEKFEERGVKKATAASTRLGKKAKKVKRAVIKKTKLAKAEEEKA